jgi:hypothetical protein
MSEFSVLGIFFDSRKHHEENEAPNCTMENREVPQYTIWVIVKHHMKLSPFSNGISDLKLERNMVRKEISS